MKDIIKALLIKSFIQFGVNTAKTAKAPKYILLKIMAGCLILVASIFALIAVHDLLAEQYSAVTANFVFALFFLLLAIIVLISVAVLRAKHKKRSPLQESMHKIDEFKEQAQQQVKHIRNEAQTAIRNHTGKILIVAALVGLIAGRRSKK